MKRRSFPAKLVRIIDGDTIRLLVDTGFYNTHENNFRLAHIDAPEKQNPEGWAAANKALAGLLDTVFAGGVYALVHCEGQDKYGRWLVTIPLYEKAPEIATVNQRMIELGAAVPYEGGKRA